MNKMSTQLAKSSDSQKYESSVFVLSSTLASLGGDETNQKKNANIIWNKLSSFLAFSWHCVTFFFELLVEIIRREKTAKTVEEQS